MDKIDILSQKFEQFIQNQSRKITEYCQTRGADVLVKAIGKLVAVFVTMYVIWHEFPELANDLDFLMLLMVWVLYGLLTFFLDYRDSKQKPISEKLDDLTEEIRGLRKDLLNILGGDKIDKQ